MGRTNQAVRSSDGNYTAAVIGVGVIGQRIAEKLAAHPAVGRLYLSSRTRTKLLENEGYYHQLARTAGKPGNVVERVEFTETEKIAEESDLTFIAFGAPFDPDSVPIRPSSKPQKDQPPKEELPDYETAYELYTFIQNQYMQEGRGNPVRMSSCIDTLPPLLNLARAWREHRNKVRGHIVIVSNPMDIAAYAFAAQSGLHFQTSGANHVDTWRFRYQTLPTEASKKINDVVVVSENDPQPGMGSGRDKRYRPAFLPHDSFCIGDHGADSIPVWEGIRLGGMITPELLNVQKEKVNLNNLHFATNEDTKAYAAATTIAAMEEVASVLFSGEGAVGLSIPATLRQLLDTVPSGAAQTYANHPLIDKVLCLGWPVRFEGKTYTPQSVALQADTLAKFVRTAERYALITDELCRLFDLPVITTDGVRDRESHASVSLEGPVDEAIENLNQALHLETKRTAALEDTLTGVHVTMAAMRQEQSNGQKLYAALGDLVKKLEPLDKLSDAVWHLVANLGSAMSAANPTLSIQIDIQTQYATAQGHYTQYKILKEQGDKKRAEEELRIAHQVTRELLQLDPQNALHHSLHGRILRYQGNSEGACQEFRKAKQLDPSNIHYTYYLALNLLEIGKREEARTVIYSTEPIPSVNALLAANIEHSLKNYQPAHTLYIRVTDTTPTFHAWFGRGLVAQRLGDFDDASLSFIEAERYIEQGRPEEQRALKECNSRLRQKTATPLSSRLTINPTEEQP